MWWRKKKKKPTFFKSVTHCDAVILDTLQSECTTATVTEEDTLGEFTMGCDWGTAVSTGAGAARAFVGVLGFLASFHLPVPAVGISDPACTT
jgi:hypothetical protein